MPVQEVNQPLRGAGRRQESLDQLNAGQATPGVGYFRGQIVDADGCHRLGGASGDGRQYVSWIHDRDFIKAVYWLIDHPEPEGPVNLSSPNPVPNAEFMRALRAAWESGFGLLATRWMLEIGAFLLRTETELILKSRRVVPGRLLESGFVFDFPAWPEAAADLCRR